MLVCAARLAICRIALLCSVLVRKMWTSKTNRKKKKKKKKLKILGIAKNVGKNMCYVIFCLAYTCIKSFMLNN